MKHLISAVLLLVAVPLEGQEALSLRACVDYALENNRNLAKSRLDMEKSGQARNEIIGALLPQLNASGSIAYNIDKNTIVMPNFMNSMLPPAMQDPDADKYMTIPMGMNNTANVGASLVQQIVNMSLFNAVNIAKSAQSMASIGLEASTEDVISQTATLYYGIQVVEYGISQFDRSIALMDSTSDVMSANLDNGIIRQVDMDRITVARTNLLSQKNSLVQAAELQKNLLKLAMGADMDNVLVIPPLDIAGMEEMAFMPDTLRFFPDALPALRLMGERQNMSALQLKAAKFETLPTLTFVANYNYYFMSDEFYTGETFHKYPMSMVSLSLKFPIFTGMSKTARIKQARIDLDKASMDREQLSQTLVMAHSNARMKLDASRKEMEAQKYNRELAERVYNVTNENFRIGINPLSDVLNSNSEMIKAEVNYVEALHNCMKAYIDLRKADGTIKEIIK